MTNKVKPFPCEHRKTEGFDALCKKLPQEIQSLTPRCFEMLQENPPRPSLHIKRVNEYWSARVGIHYRMLGKPRPYGILWFWVGHRHQYEKILRKH